MPGNPVWGKSGDLLRRTAVRPTKRGNHARGRGGACGQNAGKSVDQGGDTEELTALTCVSVTYVIHSGPRQAEMSR
ncbi:hypothetical protein PP501_gp34 [Gordonia phage Powerball]|uniref:Uncharacterized protein n=1 Tax=Gordonia phage Powerball TaxID=2599847 RepID=A0A5J6TYQ2_9CAUD|nr:hypothetical protein PP501_gp34 [Gordonia phage Powerball]QFG13512.1 hypothetical protein PBI_POWERBALL_34 [Gordonia phage Powerball]